MDEIVKLQVELLRELRNLLSRVSNQEVLDVLPFLLEGRYKKIKNKIYLFNLSNPEVYKPNQYFIDVLNEIISAIPELDSKFISERVILIDQSYLDKFIHYRKPIPPIEGIQDGYTHGDFEWEDSFIGFLGDNATMKSMIDLYPSYINTVEHTITKICDLFKIRRLQILVKGYRSVYDEGKLKLIFNKYNGFINSTEHDFVSLLVGGTSNSRIKVTFSKSRLHSFLLKMYPSGMVNSSCTIKNTFSMFTNSEDGLPMKTNNTNATNTAFYDDLELFLGSL